MEVDASSSSARTVCTIHFTDQLATRLGDQRLLADTFALDPSTAITNDSDLYWSASPVTLSPRLPALPTPSPFLRITTDNKPKDPSCGFLFGSNPTDCDIILDQTSPKQFAIKVDFKTGEIQLKNHSRTGTLIRYPESAPNNPRVLTQRSLQTAQTVDVVLSPTNFIRICSHGQISNGHLLSPVSPRYSSQNSPEFIPFTNIDMSLDNSHESTLFYFPLHPMGVGAQHSVSPIIDSNDMSLDFAQNPEMGLGFSQSSSAYSSGPFQPLGGIWANDIDPNMAPFINENVVDSSPLSQASIEPLQLQNPSPSVVNGIDPGASPFINDNVVTSSPLSHTSTEPPRLQNASPRVVQSDNNIHMEVNGKQVLFRTAQKQWDMESILRACNRSQDQHRAFKKKLSRLGRVAREGHRKYISLRDGVLLIRAVGLETELADMIAMLPESVPLDEENFLLRYQRGPQKNHLVYNNHEIAYNPEAGLIKATDLVKIANVSRRTLFAYFTRFPKMKKEVVKGGAHSGSYILLQDVPTLCRAFNIDLEVYHRLREKFPSSDRGPLAELNVNSGENLASNTEVSMTGEPPPTNGSGTTNPSSPFCEDYFGPDAEFTFHGDENARRAGDSSSRVGSRSYIPRNRISPVDVNTVNQASHGSNANYVSHPGFGSLAGYESSDPQTGHSSHGSSGSHEFPSSFYRTRGSLVLDLNLEDYTLSRYYDDFTR